MARYGGELPAEIGGGNLEAGLGLLHGHTGLEAPGRVEVVALVLGVGVELKGDPDIGRGAEFAEVEGGADDADHDVGIAAEGDGLAKNLRVAAKAPLPASLAQNHDFFAVRQVFLLGECASPYTGRAEETEIVGADLGGLKLLRKCAAGEVDHAGAKRGDVLHDAGLFPPVLEFGGRCTGSGASGRGVQEEDETVGVGKGRRFEQDRVDDGEDGGVGSDAERQCQDGGEGEARTLPEGAQRVF